MHLEWDKALINSVAFAARYSPAESTRRRRTIVKRTLHALLGMAVSGVGFLVFACIVLVMPGMTFAAFAQATPTVTSSVVTVSNRNYMVYDHDDPGAKSFRLWSAIS
jgi:hypothetical protein